MEIRQSTHAVGVVTIEDITEGRMVLFTSHPGYPTDLTGRLTDVPGVKLPDTPAEAAEASFAITWPVDNRKPPIVAWPSYPFALRQGFDQVGNTPITGVTIYTTYPGYQNSVVIPSGYQALAYAGGVYTVPSGQYVYDPTMQVPGTRLRACDTATDGEAFAGMLAILGSGTSVAIVQHFDTDTFALTFRTDRISA